MANEVVSALKAIGAHLDALPNQVTVNVVGRSKKPASDPLAQRRIAHAIRTGV